MTIRDRIAQLNPIELLLLVFFSTLVVGGVALLVWLNAPIVWDWWVAGVKQIWGVVAGLLTW